MTEDVKVRHIRHCYKADPDYGKGVAKALGIDINQIDLELKKMKHTKTFNNISVKMRLHVDINYDKILNRKNSNNIRKGV